MPQNPSQPYDIAAVKECIQNSLELIEGGAKESQLRESLALYLGRIFPDNPWWVRDHVRRGEANAAFSVEGKKRRGFIDNLVGLTAIEYEANLHVQAKFDEGYGQVEDYCASLLNQGQPQDLIVGVLSDTLRWRAYRIKEVNPPTTGTLGGEHLELEEIDRLELTQADDLNANRLVAFLLRHLGRLGSRPLNAGTIAQDLGIESRFRADHAADLEAMVSSAFASNSLYADLVTRLWSDFVSYLGDANSAAFDRSTYAGELYILTLAKLLCANVIEKKALQSDDAELSRILSGEYFEAKGLTNFVEYDYFGWLNHPPHVAQLLPIAREMQDDLRAYDFTSPPAEDLFGQMMAQLAYRSQRLLLGQEWTPTWLASRLVERTFAALPDGTEPRMVDMCCGSGTIVVEAVKLAKTRLSKPSNEADGQQSGAASETDLNRLAQTVTGFDIDPLAVLLSKVGWVLAARDWLEPFDGSRPVSIPIYHADSLLAASPLSRTVAQELAGEVHTLRFAELSVELPSFLISPKYRALFDALVERAYSVGITTASGQTTFELPDEVGAEAVEDARAGAGTELEDEQRTAVEKFFGQLTATIDRLQRDGRNGIWAFILRNSYRPGLLAGQFNGLISNPPWLALSKLANNPYRELLRRRAEEFAIKPPGPSHLHIELATSFLLHAVNRYLQDGAVVGCVLPETLLSGHHHNPFRAGAFRTARVPVALQVEELWRVQTGTFKNEAVVLFGRKSADAMPQPIPGAMVGEEEETRRSFQVVERGQRVAWSDNPAAIPKAGFFQPAAFRQGADVMPRTLFFHETEAVQASGRVQYRVSPIDRAASRLRYLVTDAKELRDFRITPRTVPERYLIEVLTSKLLAPFALAAPPKALMPIEKDSAGEWKAVSTVALAASPTAKAAFSEVLNAWQPNATTQDLFNAVNTVRNKLVNQQIPTSGFLVVTGAGGEIVCAAYAEATRFDPAKCIVDQTLYAAAVETEDAAIYLTGLLNSEAVNDVIREFQPRGAFGGRHIHTLALNATPPYDENQTAHTEVVTATKALLKDYRAAQAADPDFARLLDPNTSLVVRRRRIRAKLRALKSYEAYELACRGLYGVG